MATASAARFSATVIAGQGLGYGDAADVGITSLDGVNITGSAVIVKYTYTGDASLDGKVDLGNDFDLFLRGYLGGGTGWVMGDFNYDGMVDTADFQLFVDGAAAQGMAAGRIGKSGGWEWAAQRDTKKGQACWR